jgi:CheY-like chemotaxis protein
LTDDLEKDSHSIVPSVGSELTRPASALVRRGLLELSALGPERVVVPVPTGARILICDDEEAIVEVWGNIVLGAGYEVRSTMNPIEAIEIAREFQPHVALVGLIMPIMDGLELALELTKVLLRTKIVIMTQNNHPREVESIELLHKRGYAFDNLSWCSMTKEESLEKLEKISAWAHETRFFDLAKSTKPL